MKRADLEYAVIAATEIIRQDEVLIIGSQSILGSFGEDELPDDVTMSAEVDMIPLHDDSTGLVADILDAGAGEWSEFHLKNGFYIQGVGRETADLPAGWESRLVRVPVATSAQAGGVRRTGLCLDPHDLCVAKLSAYREKDLAFVASLIDAGFVEPSLLLARLSTTELHPKKHSVITQWLNIFTR